jgi:archaemetzincin
MLNLYQQEGLDYFELISLALRNEYNLSTIKAGKFEIPAKAFNPLRNQYDASRIIESLIPKFDNKSDLNLLITDVDLYVPRFNFIFGLAEIQERAAIVSRYRLNGSNMKERLVKEVIHEVGHLLGLPHCPVPACVMYFSNTIDDTDKKSSHLCQECRRRFEEL